MMEQMPFLSTFEIELRWASMAKSYLRRRDPLTPSKWREGGRSKVEAATNEFDNFQGRSNALGQRMTAGSSSSSLVP